MNHVKKKLNSKRGLSIVLALILMVACVLACLSIHTTIATAVNHANSEKDHQQAMILAASLAEGVREEITNVTPTKSGEDIIPPQADTISKYLYDNIGSGWSYYYPDSVFQSNLKTLTRTFTLSIPEKTDSTAELSMYWMSDTDTESSQIFTNDARTLYVTVNVQTGKESGSVTMVFYYREMQEGSNLFWWDYGESL